METFLFIIVILVIGFFWVEGIDKMEREYPHYKGKDLFDEDEAPYCPVCSGCGQEGCCSPLNCSQDPNGSYCQTYLNDLKFGYKMYDEISKLIENDPKYKEEIDTIFDRVYEEIYRNEN